MNQTEKQSIEALAVKLLMEIEQHTTLCIGDFERNIFLQGVNAGYNAALESYKDGWGSEFEDWIDALIYNDQGSDIDAYDVLNKIQELKSPPKTKTI